MEKVMAYTETIDLHGETRESAKQRLTGALKSLPKETRQLVVVHGYHGGNALREMVRNFKHPRIERKSIGLNQGETILIIKPSEKTVK